jgi:hypothetical protein
MSEPIWCEVRGHYCRCHDYGKRCDDFDEDAAPQAEVGARKEGEPRLPAVAAPSGSGGDGVLDSSGINGKPMTKEQIEAVRAYLLDLECPIPEADAISVCDMALRYLWMSADPRSRASWEFCDTKEEMDQRVDEAMGRKE